jgi:arginase
VYVGLRDVDKAERLWIRQLGIKAFTMTDIDHLGIGKVMDLALEHLKGRPLHLSYDIDSVDPLLAPATGTTVRGGLTYREAHFVAEFVAQSGDLASAEIVEVNPSLSNDDGADDTVELGLQIITSFMGKSIV